MKEELFCYSDFFNSDDLNFINQSVSAREPGRDFVIDYGVFANVKIANYIGLSDDTVFVKWLHNKIQPVFDTDIKIQTATRCLLYRPWDIHSDYFLNRCEVGYKPYYNCLISLDNFPSRTIVFDQYTNDHNDFHVYKQNNSTVDVPVSEKFWNENLNFCWPDDRLYLTLKEAMPYQQAGQFQGFPRKYFHSSDNFHQKFDYPKSFVHITIDIPDV
jgi:hypothetical protein